MESFEITNKLRKVAAPELKYRWARLQISWEADGSANANLGPGHTRRVFGEVDLGTSHAQGSNIGCENNAQGKKKQLQQPANHMSRKKM